MSINKSLDCSVCETHVDCLSALHSHHIHFHSNSQLSLGLLNARGLNINKDNIVHISCRKEADDTPLDFTMQSIDKSTSEIDDTKPIENVDTLNNKKHQNGSTKNVISQPCECNATKLNNNTTDQPSVVLERFDVKSTAIICDQVKDIYAGSNYVSILKSNQPDFQKIDHNLNSSDGVQFSNLSSSTEPIQQQELSSTSTPKTKTSVTQKRGLRRRSGINCFTDPFKVKCLQDFEYNISSIKIPTKRKPRIKKQEPRKNKQNQRNEILKNLLSNDEHDKVCKLPKTVKPRRKRNVLPKENVSYSPLLENNTEHSSKLTPLYIKTEIPHPTMLRPQIPDYQNPNMLLSIHNGGELPPIVTIKNYQQVPQQYDNYNFNNIDFNMNISTDYLDMLGTSLNGDTNITINHQNNTAITIHDKNLHELPYSDASCFDANNYEFIPDAPVNNNLPKLVIEQNDLLPVEQNQRNPYWDNSMNIYLPSETDSSSEIESYSLTAENYPATNYVMSTSGTTDCYSTWTENYNATNCLPGLPFTSSAPYYEHADNQFPIDYNTAYKYKWNCFKCRAEFRSESILKVHVQYCNGAGPSSHEDDAILDNHISKWLYESQNTNKVITQNITGKFTCLYCDIGFNNRTQYCKHLLVHKKVFDKYDLRFGLSTQDITTESTIKLEQEYE